MIEGAFVGGVVGDEQEFVVIVLFDPLVGEPLGVGGEVALLGIGAGIAEVLLQPAVEICELHDGEGDLRNDHGDPEELFDLVADRVFHFGEGAGEQALLHFHHVFVGFDIAELKVEAGELGRVLVGEGFLGAENRSALENALESRRHRHLFVKLRALREVGVAVEVLDFKHVRAALGRRADQLRRVDLDKVLFEQVVTHRVDENRLRPKHQLVLFGAEVDPAVVDALVDRTALDRLFFLGRGDVLPHDGERLGDALGFDRTRDQLDAAHFDVFVLDHDAFDGDHRIGGQRIDHRNKVGELLLLDRDLYFSRDIFQHDKRHRGAVAEILDEPLHLDLLSDKRFYVGCVHSFHDQPFLVSGLIYKRV